MSDSLHPLHRIWRCLPAGLRRKALASLTTALAPKAAFPAPRSNGAVIVAGEINRASGLGEGARLMLRALDEAGIPSVGIDLATPDAKGIEALDRIGGGNAGVGAPGDGRKAALVLHVNGPQLPAALLRLRRLLGREFLRGRQIIGYWAWELPTMSPIWNGSPACVHEIWTPSAFSADAIRTLLPPAQAGRIRVVPHPLAASPMVPAEMPRAAFDLPEAAVIVLVSFSLASSFERKNPLAAIRAFRAAFGDRPDRVLVLKVGNATHYPDDMRVLTEAVAGCGNIRLEKRMFAAEQSYALTRNADIVLSLHRSEGFGLVPAEGMLLGRVVIATDWSATAEFLEEENSLPVPYRLIPAQDPRGVFEAPGAVWAEADHDEAVIALRRAADDAALRARLGAAARDAALQHFDGKALIQAVAALS